ncbi:MAG: NADH oxidase, partial [Thermodesulfobacteriota bacterium]|nr:NADH oxidase [Thermodesulfobacteriota bacterium]
MFDNLLKEGGIGTYKVRNRMRYSATVTNFCDKTTGGVTHQEIAYLEERARSGVSIVTSQGGFPHIMGKGYPGQMGLHDSALSSGLKRLADAIKSHGAMAVGQIMHTGRYAYLKDSNVEGPPIGPSDFTSPVKRYGKCRE